MGTGPDLTGLNWLHSFRLMSFIIMKAKLSKPAQKVRAASNLSNGVPWVERILS